MDLSKAKFNEMIQSTIIGTLGIVDQALSRASLKTQNIDYVVDLINSKKRKKKLELSLIADTRWWVDSNSASTRNAD